MASLSCPHCERDFFTRRALNIHLSSSMTCRGRNVVVSTSGDARSKMRALFAPRLANPFPSNIGGSGLEAMVSVINTQDSDGDIIHPDIEEHRYLQDRSIRNKPTTIVDSKYVEYDSQLELLSAFLSFNKGVGMSRMDRNRLLSVLKNPKFKLSDITFDTAEKMDSVIDEYAKNIYGEKNYLKHSLVSTSERLKVDIICKDVVEALKLIVHENYEADDFVKESEKKIEDGKRVYSEPATGNWWTDIETMLRLDTKDKEAVVLGVILYSDATTVTQNGRESVWPLYMTLANIPQSRRKESGNFALLGFIPNEISGVVISVLKGEERQSFFFSCLEVILRSLMDLSHCGFKCNGRMLYPLLYAYVHDQPEGSKVTGTYGAGKCQYPCSVCTVPQHMQNIVEEHFPRRNKYRMERIINEIKSGSKTEKDYSVYPLENPLWGFRFSDTPVGNIYSALLVETMHQSDQGVFRRMIQWTKQYIQKVHKKKGLALLNIRMAHAMDVGFVGILKLPSQKSEIWNTLATLQANKFRSLMQIAPVLFRKLVPKEVLDCFVQFHAWYKFASRYCTHTNSTLLKMEKIGISLVKSLRTNMTPQKISSHKDSDKKQFDWDLIKVHAISHYKEDIKRSGSTRHYSAELYEHLHQKVIKKPWRGGNQRSLETETHLLTLHDKEYMRKLLGEYTLQRIRRKRLSSFDEADSNGCNVLAVKSYVRRDIEKLSQKDVKWQQFLPSLQKYIEDQGCRLTSKPKIEFFNQCQIGRSDHAQGSTETWPAYAVQRHYGKSKFSCVAIIAQEYNKEVIWYARLQALVRLTCDNEKVFDVAYIRYFKEGKDPDVETSCKKLTWEAADKRWFMVDLQNILRVVHVVPMWTIDDDFTSQDSASENFLLNEYFWR